MSKLGLALAFLSVMLMAGPAGAAPTSSPATAPPSPKVVIPSNGTTVSGTQVALDASASGDVTEVQFALTGGTLSGSVVATAVPSAYGWVAEWDSTTVADGTYILESIATSVDGQSKTGPGVRAHGEQPAGDTQDRVSRRRRGWRADGLLSDSSGNPRDQARHHHLAGKSLFRFLLRDISGG
jgi:Bacterial Ig domain